MFVKALAFAAALKVNSEHWVLLDLDQGVSNHSELLLYESKREGNIQESVKECKGRQKRKVQCTEEKI